MKEKRCSSHIDGIPLLCPLCGRELEPAWQTDGGWNCTCGEFIPLRLVIDPYKGCAQGPGSNCCGKFQESR